MVKKNEKEHDPKSPREEIDWWNDFGEGVYDCELEENEENEDNEKD